MTVDLLTAVGLFNVLRALNYKIARSRFKIKQMY